MSGTITSNVARVSGTIAATPGGLSWDTAVVTGSTVTVEAGNGYFINTTSNTCTVTLPSSAEAGDQIVFVDYARTWGTYELILDSNGLNFQGEADTYTVDYDTAGQSLNIVYSDIEGNIGLFITGDVPIRKQGDGQLRRSILYSQIFYKRYFPGPERPEYIFHQRRVQDRPLSWHPFR